MYAIDLIIRVGIPIVCGVLAGVLYGRWKNDMPTHFCPNCGAEMRPEPPKEE